jgi:hypothetical protein
MMRRIEAIGQRYAILIAAALLAGAGLGRGYPVAAGHRQTKSVTKSGVA